MFLFVVLFAEAGSVGAVQKQGKSFPVLYNLKSFSVLIQSAGMLSDLGFFMEEGV